MRLSARNVLQGKITQVKKGSVNSEVTIKLAGGETVVSIITNGAVQGLKLKKGMEAYAVIKASNVMIGVE